MNTTLNQAMNKLFHNFSLQELKLQNNPDKKNRLTYNSILYLTIIEAYPGKYTTSNLAKLLNVTKPSITQKLNELEEDGYIFKRQSETDKRIYHLYPTLKSIHYDTEYYNSDAKVEEILRNEFSTEEIDIFLKVLLFASEQYTKDKDI